MNAPLVKIVGLEKQFGSTVALAGLDWFGGGGVIGLLGPNGAGKTTLLRILATVLTPSRGTIQIAELDPAKPAERLAIRRQLGYLPQHTVLYPSFCAFDLVDYVAVLKEITDREIRQAEVRRVLTAVGLADDMHRRIRTLSGGMQRRVSLATALLGDPPFLVLDEPAAGLDPDQRLRLRDVLSKTGQRGTVIVSTHQTDEVAAFCQTVLVLDGGKIRFKGTPRELAAVANGRVWIDDQAHPGALRSWVTSDNQVRSIGTPPNGAQLVEPGIDDGYLMLTTHGSEK